MHPQEADGCQKMIKPGATGSSVSWSQSFGHKMSAREPAPDWELGPKGSRVSSTGERERSAAIAGRAGGQYVAVLFSLQLTSHT